MRTLLIALLATALGVSLCAGTARSAEKKKKKKSPDAVFQKKDKNGDKMLSLEEYVGKRTGEKAEKAKKRFAKLDKNGDGKLTLEEFKSRKKKK